MSMNRRVEKLESKLEAPEGDGSVALVLYGEVLMVPSEVPERVEKIYGDGPEDAR